MRYQGTQIADYEDYTKIVDHQMAEDAKQIVENLKQGLKDIRSFMENKFGPLEHTISDEEFDQHDCSGGPEDGCQTCCDFYEQRGRSLDEPRTDEDDDSR